MPWCPACFDESVPEDQMVYLPGCGHGLCRECWSGLVGAALQPKEDTEADSGATDVLPCPGFDGVVRCRQFVEIETIFLLMGTAPPPELKRRVEQKQQAVLAKAQKAVVDPAVAAAHLSIRQKHHAVRALARMAYANSQKPESAVPLVIPPLEELNYVEDGRTILHWASTYRTMGVIDFLYTNYPGIDINAPDNYGRTPLHYATRCGSTIIAQKLLSVGANPAPVDNDGMTPLEYVLVLFLLLLFSCRSCRSCLSFYL
ncbi:MAG: ankyrin repeat domain-containing protein [archaeon]|nr:ankyrin repeat domain-containing protein [archaeon]